MEQTEALLKTAELGIELEKFLQTDTGRYVSGCAEQDIDLAKDKFLELDPYKYSTLQDLQNAILDIQLQARVAMALQKYIGVAIVEGRQAEHQLKDEGE